MSLGPRDSLSLVMLTGWDATALKNFDLAQGTQFAPIVGQMNAALGALNASLVNDPLWSGLASFSDIPTVDYRVGSSNGMSRFTEYGRPDAKRADTEGHMVPIQEWDRMLGWTWKYLKDARMNQLQADIADAIKDVGDKWRVQVLSRLLKRGDDSGVVNGLGSSGLSPGFATDEASTGVDFVPPANAGTSFDNTHEHYVGIAGGAFTDAVFADAYNELREHGHEAPFDFIVSELHTTEILALTNSVPVGDVLVNYGDATNLANVAAGEYYAVNSHFRIREVRGMPQYYGFGYKTYGAKSQRNPLVVRPESGLALPQFTAFPDPRSGAGAIYPLQNIMLYGEFGVGVKDRTNGTARYVNNATWADGSPS